MRATSWYSICTVAFMTYMSSATARMFAMPTKPRGSVKASSANATACRANVQGRARRPNRPASHPDSRFDTTHAAPTSSRTPLTAAPSSPTTLSSAGVR
ncbi:hypothetical protein [Eggerthella sinensis]|uniref:hypothetical protein n=1 Tax=Eggerthella sinensis TaxID=242230 RepID=UPI0022E8643A|nr:hypothetical protein [Eggerthella sinensis]